MTRNSRVVLLTICCLIVFTFGCAPQQPAPPPDNRAADEAAIRQADMEWSKAADTRKLDGMMSYYAEDAMVLPPNEPLVSGKDAIRKTLGPMFESPGFSLKFQPVKVEAARSGDIGYVQGTYELAMNDPKGNPMTDKGKYVEVWKKQADGSWKCAVDTFNSDLPPMPPPPPAPTKK